MSKTEDGLKEAFAGESQANRKYLAFAKKAEEEGYKQVAKLFRAAAEAASTWRPVRTAAACGFAAPRANARRSSL